MRVRWGIAVVVFAVTLLAAPRGAASQLVQGRVRDGASRGPIQGVLVLLLDSAGASRGGVLTDAAGVFRIRAPAPGRYVLRAERIGFGTEETAPFEVQVEGGLQLALDMTAVAVAIEGLEVRGSRRCALSSDQGVTVARLWGEAQKALRNQSFVGSVGIVRFRLTQYERDLDPATRVVLSENRHAGRWVGQNPIQSLPPDSLIRGGFVQRAEPDGYQYFGPDAEVLLSHAFLTTHCFGLTPSSQDTTLVGLTFEPLASRRGAADIEGTLWLARADAKLRSLDFVYTWSPWAEASGVANGRVDFEELPEGAWIVRSWWIRMPRMVRVMDMMTGGQSGLRVAALHEVGGSAARVEAAVEAAAGAVQEAAPGVGRIEGAVWDSTGARPLVGAEVFVDDGPATVRTDVDGRFLIPDVAAGPREVSFRHALLDSLYIVAPRVDVTVAADAASRVALAVPSMASVLTALCPYDQAPGSSVVVGIVRQGTSGSIHAHARVLLEWTDYSVSGGRDISADVQTLEVFTDEQGRYRACGVPPGVLLAARASVADHDGPIRRTPVPRGGVVTLDLTVAGPHGGDSPPSFSHRAIALR